MRMIGSFVLSVFLTAPICAETLSCEGSVVRVTGPEPELLAHTCEAVKQAEVLFTQCNVPYLSAPVQINIVEEAEPGCVAQYHCGEDLIEVLALPQMQEKRDMKGVFGFLPIDVYFPSVIVHELAHAALDNLKCLLESCVATHEYVAYSMQIMSLPPDVRSKFTEIAGIDRRVSSDEINSMLLALAPDVFKRKVWAHLSQSDDPCRVMGQISDGKLFFDRDMP